MKLAEVKIIELGKARKIADSATKGSYKWHR